MFLRNLPKIHIRRRPYRIIRDIPKFFFGKNVIRKPSPAQLLTISKKELHTTKHVVTKAVINTNYINNKYATFRAHTPHPKTIPNQKSQQLENNPPIGKGSKQFQHTEIVQDLCVEEHCAYKYCTTTCDSIVNSVSKGHLTHAENYADAPEPTKKIADIDLKGKPCPQRQVRYQTPHDTQDPCASKDNLKDLKQTAQLKVIYDQNPGFAPTDIPLDEFSSS